MSAKSQPKRKIPTRIPTYPNKDTNHESQKGRTKQHTDAQEVASKPMLHKTSVMAKTTSTHTCEKTKTANTANSSAVPEGAVPVVKLRHPSGQTGKVLQEKAQMTNRLAGKSYSETRKLVHSLEEEVNKLKENLEQSTQKFNELDSKQKEQASHNLMTEEKNKELENQVGCLQEMLDKYRSTIEQLGIDPISAEKHLSDKDKLESSRTEAAKKAKDLRQHLEHFTMKNKEIIADLEELLE